MSFSVVRGKEVCMRRAHNRKVKNYNPEPPADAPWPLVLKMARRHWMAFGIYPKWYYDRKAERDKCKSKSET